MNRSLPRKLIVNTQAKLVLLVAWTALGAFIAAAFASIAYATGLAYGTRPPGALGICGNSVSDPICSVLSFGVPVLFGLAVSAGYLSFRQGVPWAHPAMFATFSTLSVSLFIHYAGAFFYPLFGEVPVFEGVWWMAPFL